MKGIIKSICVVCALAFITGCSSKDKGIKDSPLSPAEHKEKIEEIGIEFAKSINPKDHEVALQSMGVFMNLAEEDGLFETIGSVVSDAHRVIENNEISLFAEMVKNTATLDLSKFKGTYTHDGKDVWVKSDVDGDKIVIKYNYQLGTNAVKACVLEVTHAGNGFEIQSAEGKIQIPESVKITMKVNDREELSFEANDIKGNLTAPSLSTKIRLVLAGEYVWELYPSVNKEKMDLNTILSKKDQKLIHITGNMKGDFSKGQKTDDSDLHQLNDVKLNLLNKLEVRGNVNIKSINEGLKLITEKEYSEAWAKKEAELYNKHMKFEMIYPSEEKRIANLKMQPLADEYGYYYSDFVLEFVSDKSTVALDKFFASSDFASLIAEFQKLAQGYGNIFAPFE